MAEKLLSIGQATNYLNVSRASIDRWQGQGILRPFYTPGGHRRFRESDLRAALGMETRPNGGGHVPGRIAPPPDTPEARLRRQQEQLLAHVELLEKPADKTRREELVNDLITLVNAFSTRIYEQRGKQVADQVSQTLRQALHEESSLANNGQ